MLRGAFRALRAALSRPALTITGILCTIRLDGAALIPLVAEILHLIVLGEGHQWSHYLLVAELLRQGALGVRASLYYAGRGLCARIIALEGSGRPMRGGREGRLLMAAGRAIAARLAAHRSDCGLADIGPGAGRAAPRVFLRHDRDPVPPELQAVLDYGSFECVRAEGPPGAHRAAFDAIRECDCAIIRVGAAEGAAEESERLAADPDVLPEIGAALACHGGRVILLADERVALPDSMSHVPRYDYGGDGLSSDGAMRILQLLAVFKSSLKGGTLMGEEQ